MKRQLPWEQSGSIKEFGSVASACQPPLWLLLACFPCHLAPFICCSELRAGDGGSVLQSSEAATRMRQRQRVRAL
uniref:Uncharacterized protein n=1 Tax=Oryza meridionalis TaxID=40149 RepID=A0A0E0ETP5_9ORYZ